MKVTLAAAMSLNGKITNGADAKVSAWSSGEEQVRFSELVDEHDVIVVGSKTYQIMRDHFHHQPGKLRLILTSRPDDYRADVIPGQLEFSSETPAELVNRLEQAKKQKLLVAGGPVMMASFLQAGLVDELELTLEPLLFGEGKSLLERLSQDIGLQLVSCTQLNDRGTLLLVYKPVP